MQKKLRLENKPLGREIMLVCVYVHMLSIEKTLSYCLSAFLKASIRCMTFQMESKRKIGRRDAASKMVSKWTL